MWARFLRSGRRFPAGVAAAAVVGGGVVYGSVERAQTLSDGGRSPSLERARPVYAGKAAKEEEEAQLRTRIGKGNDTRDQRTANDTAEKALDSGEEAIDTGEEATDSLEEGGVDKDKIRVFSGSANPQLAAEVTSLLGIELGRMTVDRFEDGEVNIQVKENVRGRDVYIIQPTGPPVNDNIIELLMLVSTMRRASARQITAVIPYYGYGRQDRKREARETIGAADVARLLEAVGVDRVVCVDLHSGQTQGFFRRLTPVENLSTYHDLVVPYFMRKNLHRPVIVSPSGTGLQRVKRIRDEFHLQGVETGLAFVSPKDDRGSVVVSQVTHHHRVHDEAAMILVGDVHDCDVVLVDDMVDTGSRMRLAARSARQNGAKRVYAVCTHGLFSLPDFDENLAKSAIRELVVTNTIARPEHVKCGKVRYLSVAPMIADAIYRLHRGLPLSLLVTQAS